MQKRKRLFSLIVILIFIWLMLFNLGRGMASPHELALATTLYFVCSLPLLIYFARSEKSIPYFPIFGILYFMYFGLTIFNNYNLISLTYLTPDIIIRCLNLSLWGFISLMIAFYTPIGKIVDLIFVPLKIPWDPRKAYRLGIFIGFLAIFIHYLNLSRILTFIYAALINFIIGLSRLGIAILFMLQLQNKLKFNGRIILWFGLFIPRVFLDLSSGSTFPIILDFMILLFCSIYYLKSIPWLKLIIMGVMFLIIFSVRDRFRELTWYDGAYANVSPMRKGVLYIELILKRLSGGEREAYRYAYERFSARSNNLITFARVLQLTPSYIPFWDGYTYRTLLPSLIPRFISPEKPRKVVGQEFGHRYMLLDPLDTISSYNLSLLIEMYINFGVPGVIIGMFILGLIFRIFYTLFNHPEAGEGGFMISVMISINLLNIESDFSLIFGNILQYTIMFYFIIRTMKLSLRKMGI